MTRLNLNSKSLKQTFGNLSRRQMVTAAIIFVAGLVVIGFFSSFMVVRVTYSATSVNLNSGDVRVTTYTAASGERSPVSRLSSSWLLVPRGTESLAFTSGESESLLIAPADLASFGYAAVDVSLQPLAKASKLSSGGELCPVINSSGSYSHACDFPTGINKYEPSAKGLNRQARVLDFRAQFTSEQYGDGVLMWSNQPVTRSPGLIQPTVSYIVPGRGVAGTITMPDAIAKSAFVTIVTDRGNRQNDSFVVYDYAAGTGYYYPSFSESTKPRIIKRQFKLDPNYQISSCVLAGSTFSCYHGSGGEHTHKTENPDLPPEVYNRVEGGVIEVADMSNSQPAVKTYKNDHGDIDDLYAIGDSLFGRSATELRRISLDGDNFDGSTISTNATIIAAGSRLNYVQANRVYQYDAASGSAHLLYDHDKQAEIVAKLAAYGDTVLSLAYQKRDPLQLINTYRLTTD